MTPEEFIAKWCKAALKERSGSQEHFIDLCRLLDEPTPAEGDPTGEVYCFERGARKDRGSHLDQTLQRQTAVVGQRSCCT